MKKVLIVNGTAIGERNGTGVTFQNLWGEYPISDLLQLLVTPFETQRNMEVPTIHTPLSYCLIPYLSLYRNRKSSKNTGINLNANIAQNSLKSKMHDFVRGIFDCWPVHIRTIKKEIDEFKPEVVYTCGSSIRIMKTAYKIAKHYKIPVVLHLMDDWPTTVYTSSIFTKPFHWIINQYLFKLANMKGQNFAISTALCEKYENILNTKFSMLMNPAMNVSNDIKYEYNSTLQFVYAGSLTLNRWKSLLDIAEELYKRRLNGQSNVFDLYIPCGANTVEMKENFEKFGASLMNYIPSNELLKIYDKSDILVFTESFESNVIEFIKYSLSTKIPEYMATGRLLLSYLSPQLHSYEYIKGNNIGLVASNRAQLSKALDMIFNNRQDCYKIQKNALNEIVQTHSKNVVIERLYSAINYQYKDEE